MFNKKKIIAGLSISIIIFSTMGVSNITSNAASSSKSVIRTRSGFVTINGEKYYYSPKTGKKVKGYQVIDGKKYYFSTSSGKMLTGLRTVAVNNTKYTYYFLKTGDVFKGGLKEINGKKYYFSTSSGKMLTGLRKTSNGNSYYFLSSGGVFQGGFKEIDGKKYYFNTGSGKMAVGWTTIGGNKYYFDKETGVMATGDVTIDEQKYHFNSNGILSNTTSPTGSRTIKNYLAGALQPVGQALYVWGGGWNDSTRKGTSQTMTDFYNSQSSSYDYNNYRDLSTANRAKGFDCSGFVGWSAYQVMQSKSGVGSGYTVVSGEIGSYYKSMGWGSILTQANLASDDWTVYPGDVGYDSGHTWIILGQCADKSAVIVHSTPNAGVQIAGTPTPSGGYSSQAIALAQKYMSRYPGYTKYDYHTSSGNYIRRGNYLRWNRSTLSDPDGYMNMTADQILADLFS